jgi:hypothetical protein
VFLFSAPHDQPGAKVVPAFTAPIGPNPFENKLWKPLDLPASASAKIA